MRIVITFQRRDDLSYLPLIDMAFQSAKRFGYETVLVSNENSLGCDDLLVLPTENEPHLMNWILAAQLAYIESPLFNQPSVFFSPDALIVKALEPVFEMDFDVAFTDRDNPKWPINNGVIYLKPDKREYLAALWRDALATCKTYDIATQDWYGDQKSLHDIYVAGRHIAHGVSVELLPCHTYNATPAKNVSGIDRRMLRDAYVAHFKGKRKDMMKDYWRHLCTKG